jgi:hypothetical protein
MILSDAITLTGTEIHEHLDRQAEVPVITTAGCQGDVIIHRVDGQATTPLPRAGAVLVRSEASTHTHMLHGEGCLWDPAEDGLTLGTLTIPGGREALITHQEHGALLVRPGSYRIGRQREFAGEWRMVAD